MELELPVLKFVKGLETLPKLATNGFYDDLFTAIP